MKKLRQTYHFKAPVSRVWQALVDPKAIDAWGGGPNVKMNDRVGSKFELWDGSIYGTNTDLVKEKRLVQDWYSGDWPQASKVTFLLEPEEGGTRVLLLHDNIPDEEYEDIKAGWKEFYLGPMRKSLEKAKS